VPADLEAVRLRWFEERTPAHPASVAEVNGEVVAWAAPSPWKGRCAYQHSVERSVYVRPDWHRRGVGRALGFEQVACFREMGNKFGRWLDVAYFQLMLYQPARGRPEGLS
jgi:phosphinothricin acetyltransferase